MNEKMQIQMPIGNQWDRPIGVRTSKVGKQLKDIGYLLIRSTEDNELLMYNKTIDTDTMLTTLSVYGVEGEIRLEVDTRKKDSTRVKAMMLVYQPSKFAGAYEFYHNDELGAVAEAEKVFVEPDSVAVPMMYGIGEKEPYVRRGQEYTEDGLLAVDPIATEVTQDVTTYWKPDTYMEVDYSRSNGEATWVKYITEPVGATIMLRRNRASRPQRYKYTILLNKDDKYIKRYRAQFSTDSLEDGEHRVNKELKELIESRDAGWRPRVVRRRVSRMYLHDTLTEAGYRKSGFGLPYSILDYTRATEVNRKKGSVMIGIYNPSQVSHRSRYVAYIQLWRKRGDAMEIELYSMEDEDIKDFLVRVDKEHDEFSQDPAGYDSSAVERHQEI